MTNDGPALDDHQYTVSGLHAYEAIYGRDFVSPGGRRTTAEVFDLVDWHGVGSVLDVGCGLGGAAFMIAQDRGVQVEAIDLSQNMVDEAARRCEDYGLSDLVTVSYGDIVTARFDGCFDVVHSREVFLHIHDKEALFARLNELLVPGGQLIFTDYCCGPGAPSAAFAEYVVEFGYDLRTVSEIGALLVEAGFENVSAVDRTEQFIDIHKRELQELACAGLPDTEKDDLRSGWLNKIDRARRGEQRWGLFQAHS